MSFTPQNLRFALLAGFSLPTFTCPARSQAAPARTPQAQKAAHQLPFTISGPMTTLPRKSDVLQRFAQGTAGTQGRLVYFGRLRLTIRAVGYAPPVKASLVSYEILPKSGDILYAPQFSPDGRTLVFRYGWPYDSPYTSSFYVLDLQSHQVREGPTNAGSTLLWSPNSKYIAFATSDGLYLYNVARRKGRLVMRSQGVDSVAWSSHGTLLFTLRGHGLSPTPSSSTSETTTNQTRRPLVPSIYEVATTGSQPQLLLEGGFAPAPSPDGRWLIYFGSSVQPPLDAAPQVTDLHREAAGPQEPAAISSHDPEEAAPEKLLQKIKDEAEDGTRLCLYDRIEKKRYLLDANMEGAVVRWTPDGKRAVVMKTAYDRLSGAGEAHIYTVDAQSKTMKLVTTVQSKDLWAIPRDASSPQFQLLQVPNDGKNLIIRVHQVLPSEDGGRSNPGASSIRAVNLENGQATTLAVAQNASGLDWHDESTPVRTGIILPRKEQR